MPRVKPGQRKRALKPKTRTGCITCKIRRIKCDEARPACVRCSSTGRKCDGYDYDKQVDNNSQLVVQPQTISVTLPANGPVTKLFGSDKEHRSFDFFCHRSASHLAGFYGCDFWERLVLRAAHFDQGIRHAIVALGTIHERFSSRYGSQFLDDRDDEHVKFALSQYNLAIKEIVNPTGRRQRPTADVYLASCLIFICIEMLRGHLASAVSLVRNGLTILHADNDRSGDAPLVPFDAVATLFDRLELQVIGLVGRQNWGTGPTKRRTRSTVTIPHSFLSVGEARDLLEYHWHEYTIKNLPGPATTESSAKDYDMFRRWSLALSRFVKARGKNLTAKEKRGLAILQVQKLMLSLSLDVSTLDTDSDEMPWDNFCPVFQRIVDLAGAALDLPTDQYEDPAMSTREPTFSVDMGLIGPLYDTACACRDPKIRRQAVALLRAMSRQEGLWDGILASRVAARVIEIEEAGLDVQSCKDVPLIARLTGIVPTFDPDGRRAQIRYQKFDKDLGEVCIVSDHVEW